MKILFLGQISQGQTSLMRMRALERLGHEVHGVNTSKVWAEASWLKRQVQRRVLQGSIINELNDRARKAADYFRPQLIWAEKQEYLTVETVQSFQKLGAKVIHFTPDPYFSLSWKRTRLMDEAMKEFDAHVYCKTYEAENFTALGKPCIYMPLGYCDEVHRPLPSSDPKWNCGIGFLGGWEPRRERFLAGLAEANLPLKIWGGYWDHLSDGKWTLRRKIILNQLAGADKYRIAANKKLAACLQGDEVYSDDYARALTGSKIGLGFLRKVCADQHTTRTFEIPACGSMLLADRTQEHQEFFTEGTEAEYFDSPEELLDKATFYIANENARTKVAAAGLNRCRDSNYSYYNLLGLALKEISPQIGLHRER